MFRVKSPKFEAEFVRWTDALARANSLKATCKSLFEDIRIYYGEELLWVYSRSHKYPQYIGAGTYDKLARLFIQEATAEKQNSQAESE